MGSTEQMVSAVAAFSAAIDEARAAGRMDLVEEYETQMLDVVTEWAAKRREARSGETPWPIGDPDT